jgi:Raf kinase inhibitor-like YbhB/YbcL family protein
MSKHLAAFLLLTALAAAPASGQRAARAASGPGLTLSSPAFADCAIIPNKFTADATGTPVSPPLQWAHVPPGTVSFALLIEDPDTAMRKSPDEVIHWMIFNIPGSAHSLPEGVPNQARLPDGAIQGKNTRGTSGFMGPAAPPAGPYHHYLFQLYALDTKLDLGPDATREDVLKAMAGHVLGKGVMVGRFHR